MKIVSIRQLRSGQNLILSRLIALFFWCAIFVSPVFGSNALHLVFDGKFLAAYQQNQIILKLPAVAGRPFFQSPNHQYLKNKGPLPEGTYIVELGHTVYFNQPGIRSKFKWIAKYIAWGNLAIPLTPEAGSALRGRHSFMIHGGGWGVGSKGCIVVYQNDRELYRVLSQSDGIVKLIVKYEK